MVKGNLKTPKRARGSRRGKYSMWSLVRPVLLCDVIFGKKIRFDTHSHRSENNNSS